MFIIRMYMYLHVFKKLDKIGNNIYYIIYT